MEAIHDQLINEYSSVVVGTTSYYTPQFLKYLLELLRFRLALYQHGIRPHHIIWQLVYSQGVLRLLKPVVVLRGRVGLETRVGLEWG